MLLVATLVTFSSACTAYGGGTPGGGTPGGGTATEAPKVTGPVATPKASAKPSNPDEYYGY